MTKTLLIYAVGGFVAGMILCALVLRLVQLARARHVARKQAKLERKILSETELLFWNSNDDSDEHWWQIYAGLKKVYRRAELLKKYKIKESESGRHVAIGAIRQNRGDNND